jgi:hypothetical protein
MRAAGGASCALVLLLSLAPRCGALDPSFDASFEGGNVDARWSSDNTIEYSGALRGTSPYHAWFYFQILNASTTAPTALILTQSEWPEPPWLSYDDTTYVRASNCSGARCVFLAARRAVFVAYSTPYVTRHADALSRAVAASGLGATGRLALSEGGRPVPLVSVTDPAGGSAGKTAVWLLARQHAWEASASWVADSIVAWAVSADPLAAAASRTSTPRRSWTSTTSFWAAAARTSSRWTLTAPGATSRTARCASTGRRCARRTPRCWAT